MNWRLVNLLANLVATGAIVVVSAPLFAQNAPDTWARDFVINVHRIREISNFEPKRTVSRAHLASALDLLTSQSQIPTTSQDLPRDVPTDHWASQAIARTNRLKIISLVAGQFQPDRPVQKGEALIAIARALGLDNQKIATPKTLLANMYEDGGSIPAQSRVAIAALSARGLVVNYPNVRRLNFNQPITQAELVALLHQGLVQQRRLPRLASRYIPDPNSALSRGTPQVSLLVVNLTRRELTAFRGNTKLKTYPIAVGRAGWETPTGSHQVQQLIERPAWKNPFTGDVIESGDPDNPLGERWIGFWTNGKNWWGFHGTPNRGSVGRAVSHGCIRMFNEDIVELFPLVSTQTIVRVVR